MATSPSMPQDYHVKGGLRSQMNYQAAEPKSLKIEIKDSNMGHFYIKLQDSDR